MHRYSDQCFPVVKITEPTSGYIHVNCTATNATGRFTVYENLHVLAKFSVENEEKISEIQQHWNNCSRAAGNGQTDSSCGDPKINGKPPNVVLLGIDSTSRLNFNRFELYKWLIVCEILIFLQFVCILMCDFCATGL